MVQRFGETNEIGFKPNTIRKPMLCRAYIPAYYIVYIEGGGHPIQSFFLEQ